MPTTPAPIDIVLHDYSGHPFQAQLSRSLARRGHTVTHVTSADFQTPKGRLEPEDVGQGRLTILNLSLGQEFQKDTFIRRRAQEEAFGRLVGAHIERLRPAVVLSSNAPLDTQRGILKATRRAGAGFVFWVQDLYGEAIYRILSDRLGQPGRAVGRYYRWLEHRMLRASDAAVVISEDFLPILGRNNAMAPTTEVIENWAPLDEVAYLGPAPSRGGPVRLTYSGTLGYKHNPEVLSALAQLEGAEVAVYSEGRVAEELKREAAPGARLQVSPWVPFDALPKTLADADILLAMIEADAGVFSVPSKVLTYLCAGRPVLASVPEENLARRILVGSGAGFVTPPGDIQGFLDNARALIASPDLRADMGRKGRAYAERMFDIESITDRFERVLVAAATPRERVPARDEGSSS